MMKTYTEDPPSARLCFLLLLVAFWGLSWLVSDHVDLIEWLGGHRMSPPFADLRSLTGGVDCLRQGIDPSGSENPCDPWNRPLNYPPPWLDLFFFFGLSGSTTVILGLLTAILFYTALFLAVFPKEDRGFGPAIGWSVFVFSPAILLGVERGNNDYVIFRAQIGAQIRE